MCIRDRFHTMSMEFKVITPDEVAVAATVEYVYLPGSLGEMGAVSYTHLDVYKRQG